MSKAITIFVVIFVLGFFTYSCVTGAKQRFVQNSRLYLIEDLVAHQQYERTHTQYVYGAKGQIISSYPVTNTYDYWLFNLQGGEVLQTDAFIKPGSRITLSIDNKDKNGVMHRSIYSEVIEGAN